MFTIVAVAGATVASGSGQLRALDPQTGAYLAVVESYRRGPVADAVSDIRAWQARLLERLVANLSEQIAGRLSACRERPDQIPYATLDAAILLHTDAALAAMRESRSDEGALHLEQAHKLLEWVSRQVVVLERTRRSAEAETCGEPRPLVARDWLLAVTRLCLRVWTLPPAERLARQLLRVAPEDPDALFAAGNVREALATNDAQYYLPPPVWRLSDSDVRRALGRHQQALRDQERYREEAVGLYERALAVSSDRQDIRLRLGWVSVLLGREHAARAALETVAAHEGPMGDRYLAALFLGRLCQNMKRFDEAVTWYERAGDLLPSAHVARLGLAYVLESTGEMTESLRSLERADDPWLEYPHGNWRAGAALLDRLRHEVMYR